MKPAYRTHSEAVLAYLRSIGAMIMGVRRARRIAIEWRWHGHHGVTRLPLSSGSPASCAGREIARIRRVLGIEVAA